METATYIDGMDRHGAARYLGIASGTLRNWASTGIGPAYYKVGGRVTYRRIDLDRFMESRRVEPSLDGAA